VEVTVTDKTAWVQGHLKRPAANWTVGARSGVVFSMIRVGQSGHDIGLTALDASCGDQGPSPVHRGRREVKSSLNRGTSARAKSPLRKICLTSTLDGRKPTNAVWERGSCILQTVWISHLRGGKAVPCSDNADTDLELLLKRVWTGLTQLPNLVRGTKWIVCVFI
jgi:hypothetical protein